jgi:hypothetical protein
VLEARREKKEFTDDLACATDIIHRLAVEALKVPEGVALPVSGQPNRGGVPASLPATLDRNRAPALGMPPRARPAKAEPVLQARIKQDQMLGETA